MTSRAWIEEQMHLGLRVVELGGCFYVFEGPRNRYGPFRDREAAEAVLAKHDGGAS